MASTFVGYVAAMVVWNLLRLTPLSGWPPFALVDIFGWAFFLVIPILAAIAFWKQTWTLMALLAIPALIFSIEYGPVFTPGSTDATDSFAVMTGNLSLYNSAGPDVDELLLEQMPDIFAVQELSESMAERLAVDWPFTALYASRTTEGMGVVSRFPIRRQTAPDMAEDACRCHEVEIDVDGLLVTLFNVHMRPPGLDATSFDPTVQEASIDVLLDRIQRTSTPVLVAGDFNVSDRGYLYRRLRSRLGDTHRDAGSGFGFTWPEGSFVRIDYILHGPGWRTASAHTGPLPGSDHRYVKAELARR